MLSFFDNVSNFFVSIWQLIWNSIQLLIDGIQLALSMTMYTNALTLWVPSIIGLSMSLVVAICVLRFLMLK